MFCDNFGIVPSTTASFSSKYVAPFLPRPLQHLAAASKPRVKVILAYLIVLGFSLGTKAQTSLAIAHVAVIDVVSGVVQPDETILIDDNVISRVGPSTDVHPPDGARVIDAHGQFLIPGLWDMHVHLGNATEASLPVLVSNGITGVRDMGSPSYATLHRWSIEALSGTRIGGPLVRNDALRQAILAAALRAGIDAA